MGVIRRRKTATLGGAKYYLKGKQWRRVFPGVQYGPNESTKYVYTHVGRERASRGGDAHLVRADYGDAETSSMVKLYKTLTFVGFVLLSCHRFTLCCCECPRLQSTAETHIISYAAAPVVTSVANYFFYSSVPNVNLTVLIPLPATVCSARSNYVG